MECFENYTILGTSQNVEVPLIVVAVAAQEPLYAGRFGQLDEDGAASTALEVEPSEALEQVGPFEKGVPLEDILQGVE